MSIIKNLPSEPDPRLQQMLAAYGNTPERDPAAARRTEARFRAELDALFPEPLAMKPAAEPWGLSIMRTLNKNPTRWLTQRPAVLLGLSLVVLWACFFGVGTTAYAASSALPGDRLYSLKTVVESVRAELSLDSAHQARLYMDFAGRRLVEMQALLQDHRFADLDRAARAYEMDLQKSLDAVETAAQNQPGKAVALRQEMLVTLQTYSRILAGSLAGAPGEAQSGIQNAIDISVTASAALDERLDDEDDRHAGNLGGRRTDDECLTHSPGSHVDDDCETPRREVGETATPTPQPSATPSNNSNNDDDGSNNGSDDDAGTDDGGSDDGRGDDDGDDEGQDDEEDDDD